MSRTNTVSISVRIIVGSLHLFLRALWHGESLAGSDNVVFNTESKAFGPGCHIENMLAYQINISGLPPLLDQKLRQGLTELSL